MTITEWVMKSLSIGYDNLMRSPFFEKKKMMTKINKKAKRLEGIQIVLVPKNGKAPATRYQGITSVRTQAYIKK